MMLTAKKILILSLVAVSVFGCKTFSRMMAKSGSEFVVQVETNEPNKDEIFQQAINKLKNEADILGLVAEVSEIPDKPYQIDVKIYEPKDIERTKIILFTNYQLELKKVVSPPNPSPLKTFPTEAAAGREAAQNQEVLPYNDKNKDLQKFVIVEKEPIITGSDIRLASATNGQNIGTDYSVSFSLNTEGATKFGDWTGKNIGSYLAIVLNKNVVSIAFIKSQINDRGQIDGRFTKATAEDIALSLNSGHLPANFKVLSETVFGK